MSVVGLVRCTIAPFVGLLVFILAVMALEAIGHDAGKRREYRRGQCVRHGHDAEPGSRFGELPGEPPHSDPLKPETDE